MATPLKRSPCLGFGPFEVDVSAGELRKSGVRVRLAGQPFQILLVLLAHPGEVVTREQLREEISGRIAYRFYCRHLLHELMGRDYRPFEWEERDLGRGNAWRKCDENSC